MPHRQRAGQGSGPGTSSSSLPSRQAPCSAGKPPITHRARTGRGRMTRTGDRCSVHAPRGSPGSHPGLAAPWLDGDEGPASWEVSAAHPGPHDLLPQKGGACASVTAYSPSCPGTHGTPAQDPQTHSSWGRFQTPGQTPSLPRGHTAGPAARWLGAPSPPRSLTPQPPETSLKPSWRPPGLGEPSVSKDQGLWGQAGLQGSRLLSSPDLCPFTPWVTQQRPRVLPTGPTVHGAQKVRA